MITTTGIVKRRPSWNPKGLLLFTLLFFPGMIGFFREGVSFAIGTALCGALSLGLVAAGYISFRARELQSSTLVVGAALFAILVHLVFAIAISSQYDFDVIRSLLSLLLLAIVLIAAPTICAALMERSDGLSGSIKVVCAVFIVIALMSLLKIQPPSPSAGAKPTFPYTEPSFLGFSLPAILIFTMARSSVPVRAVWLLAFLSLAYGLRNFTMVIACLLAALTTMPLVWIAAGGVVGFLISASLNLSYYLERLDFNWATSTNLSALVYVQGWQLLQNSLARSWGWGLGFQQLGVGYTNVPASFRIDSILGRDANLQDGGFVLSKLGSEFGIFGIGLFLIFLYIAGFSFIKIRRSLRTGPGLSDGDLFARACVVGYAVEMVIRGSGYFTGTSLLFLAGVVYLYRRKKSVIVSAKIS